MDVGRTVGVHEQTQLRERAARVLEAGFRIAVVIMGAGLILAIVQREPLPSTMEQPVDIVCGVFEGEPGAIVGLGIVSIILTPFVSTLVIAVTFLRQGDRRCAMVSGLVLLILLISIGLSLI